MPSTHALQLPNQGGRIELSDGVSLAELEALFDGKAMQWLETRTNLLVLVPLVASALQTLSTPASQLAWLSKMEIGLEYLLLDDRTVELAVRNPSPHRLLVMEVCKHPAHLNAKAVDYLFEALDKDPQLCSWVMGSRTDDGDGFARGQHQAFAISVLTTSPCIDTWDAHLDFSPHIVGMALSHQLRQRAQQTKQNTQREKGFSSVVPLLNLAQQKNAFSHCDKYDLLGDCPVWGLFAEPAQSMAAAFETYTALLHNLPGENTAVGEALLNGFSYAGSYKFLLRGGREKMADKLQKPEVPETIKKFYKTSLEMLEHLDIYSRHMYGFLHAVGFKISTLPSSCFVVDETASFALNAFLQFASKEEVFDYFVSSQTPETVGAQIHSFLKDEPLHQKVMLQAYVMDRTHKKVMRKI